LGFTPRPLDSPTGKKKSKAQKPTPEIHIGSCASPYPPLSPAAVPSRRPPGRQQRVDATKAKWGLKKTAKANLLRKTALLSTTRMDAPPPP